MTSACNCCVDRIYAQAEEVLAAVVSTAASCEVNLPCKQGIVAGDTVYDCEQVVVGMSTVLTGLPGGANSQTPASGSAYSWGCSPSWMLRLTVAIVRCGPKIAIDGTSKMEDQSASARERAQDAAVLMRVGQQLALNSFGAVPTAVTFSPRQDLVATVGGYDIAVGAVCQHPVSGAAG